MGQLCWQCDELVEGVVWGFDESNDEAIGADVPVLGAAIDVSDAVWDVPADALNASTGTGEELGWFGEVDKHLDYRALTGELDPNDPSDWADPEDEGFFAPFHALAGQGASATEDSIEFSVDAASEAGGIALGELLDSPILLGLALLVAIYVVGQLFDVNLGGSSA